MYFRARFVRVSRNNGARLAQQLERVSGAFDANNRRSFAPATDFEVKVLRHAKAAEVSRALKDLFPEKDGWSLRVTADERTNSLLVRGTEKDLKAAEKVIKLLEKMSNK